MTTRHGLANVGNTCYLNSAMQALCKSAPFQAYFGTEAWTKHRHSDRKGYDLAGNVAHLVTDLNAPGNTMINPSKFVRTFIEFANPINDDIRFGAQACAAEAIQILLDGLHVQQSREVLMSFTGDTDTTEFAEMMRSLESWKTFFHKEFSPLVNEFYGQTQVKVACGGCAATSTRYEPWGVLKVSIPGADKAGAAAPNLARCISSTLEKEKLDDYVCDTCKARGLATMTPTISRFPPYIILSLKRFTNTGAKVRARIAYDEERIDLSEHCAWPTLQDKPVYRVVSTIEHLGSSRGGHYVMRNRDSSDGKWYVYDDGNVTLSSGAAGPDTYVLFLERLE